MSFSNLPLEIFRQIIEEYVASTTHQSDLKNLQLVNKRFDGEVTKAVSRSGRLFSFAGPEPYFPEYLRYMFYSSNKKDDYLAWSMKHVTNELIKYDTSERNESSERIPLVVSRAAIDFMVYGLRRSMTVGLSRRPITSRQQNLEYVNGGDDHESERSIIVNANQTWDAVEHLLSAAAYIGNVSLVEHLLGQKDVDLNFRSNIFGSPLRNAALRRHFEIVKLLLDKGADADSGRYPRPNEESQTKRRHRRHRRQIRSFGSRLADVYKLPGTALQAAARSAHKEIVQLLLQPEFHISRSTDSYHDAMLFAAMGGDADIQKMLIEGADFSMIDTSSLHLYWNRMLRFAGFSGKIETMPLLLEKGADINNHDIPMDYCTPLGLAALNGHDEAILFLLQNGADINAGDPCPIYLAGSHGFSRTIRLLLDRGAQLYPGGHRTIEAATREGYADVVRVFSEKGLHNLRIRERPCLSKYESLLQVAKSLGHQRVVRVLEEFGAVE